MSKELEALENLRQWVLGEYNDDIKERNAYEIVEKELKEYENLQLKHRSMQDAVLDDFKKLKALEIIKNKRVNVRCLTVYCLKLNDTYKDYLDVFNYCDNCWDLGEILLTSEEYNLLKEVLL